MQDEPEIIYSPEFDNSPPALTEPAHLALDKFYTEEVEQALEQLEGLEKAATPGPWREGIYSDSVVTTEADATPDSHKGYGGNLVFESCRASDKHFLIALRNRAEWLIRTAKSLTHTLADLDGVHEALKLPYESSAAAAVRALVERVKQQSTIIQGLEETIQLMKEEGR